MEFEGDVISYSAERDIDYNGQDLDVSIYYSNENLTSGVYTAEVYMDGYKIGTAEVSLR